MNRSYYERKIKYLMQNINYYKRVYPGSAKIAVMEKQLKDFKTKLRRLK